MPAAGDVALLTDHMPTQSLAGWWLHTLPGINLLDAGAGIRHEVDDWRARG